MDRAPIIEPTIIEFIVINWIIEPTIIQFIVARFVQGMLLKLVEQTAVRSDRKLKTDKGLIIFFYSYLVVGRIHHFRTTAHTLFIALFSRTVWFASLLKVSSYRLKSLLCNTRRTIVSTSMREQEEAVLFHFLFHSTVCVFN